MKLLGCVDVLPFTSSADIFSGERRYQFRAVVRVYGVAIGDADDFPDAVANRAAEAALRHAGLRAAVYFDADILPFLDLRTTLKRGDDVGHIDRINRRSGEESVGVQWPTRREEFHPAELSRYIRAGGLDLA